MIEWHKESYGICFQTKGIVVKIGSSSIVKRDRTFNQEVAGVLADDIVKVRNSGMQVLLVSSGAVALGTTCAAGETRESKAERGQIRLMEGWKAAFGLHSIAAQEVLVEEHDLRNINFFNALLQETQSQSVINGNDRVCRLNNDNVAGELAQRLGAYLLILTNVEGFLKGEKVVPFLTFEEIESNQFGEQAGSSEFGLGGMRAKLEAVARYRRPTLIASACQTSVISRFLSGEDFGTYIDEIVKQ